MNPNMTDADLRNWSLLAARALDDCFRVIETIEPESDSEARNMSELQERVAALFSQALTLNGILTRSELETFTTFQSIDLSTRVALLRTKDGYQ